MGFQKSHGAGVGRYSGHRRFPYLWKLRDHGLYIAYAPVDKPRYACAAVIEHGGLASHLNVQVARDALLLAQKRDILGRLPSYPLTSADASL